jgi:hypothetical protein
MDSREALLKAHGLAEVKIERTADGTLFIDGVDTTEMFDFIDSFVEKHNFKTPHMFIVFAEAIAIQAAYHDHQESSFFFLELFTNVLGGIYNQHRTLMAAAQAMTPPKDKLN